MLGDEVSYSFYCVNNIFSEFFSDHRNMCFESDTIESEITFTDSPYCLEYIGFTFWIAFISPEIFENPIFFIRDFYDGT